MSEKSVEDSMLGVGAQTSTSMIQDQNSSLNNSSLINNITNGTTFLRNKKGKILRLSMGIESTSNGRVGSSSS